jgi:hypothetical protein
VLDAVVKSVFGEEENCKSELDTTFFALGNDGASVLTGHKAGFGAQLRVKRGVKHLLQLHCVCHKLALAAKEAVSLSPPMQYMDKILRATYALVAHSSKNKAQLSDLRKLLGEKDITLKQLAMTRWLARGDCLAALVPQLGSVVTLLKDLTAKKMTFEVEEVADSEGLTGATTRKKMKPEDLLTQLKSFGVVFSLHYLCDLIGTCNKLSLFMQRDDVTLYGVLVEVKAAVKNLEQLEKAESLKLGPQAAKFYEKIEFDTAEGSSGGIVRVVDGLTVKFTTDEFEKSIRVFRYTAALLKATLRSRFPKEGVLDSLCTLDPQSHRGTTAAELKDAVGVKYCLFEQNFETLAEHFGGTFVNKSGLEEEAPLVWESLSQVRAERGHEGTMRHLAVHLKAQRTCENSLKMLCGLMIAPVSNALVERLVSKMTFVKNDKATNMNDSTLQTKMELMTQAPPPGTAAAKMLVEEVAGTFFGEGNRQPKRANGAHAAAASKRRKKEERAATTAAAAKASRRFADTQTVHTTRASPRGKTAYSHERTVPAPCSLSLSRTVAGAGAGTLSLAHYSQRTASCFLLAVAHCRSHTVACALLSAHCVLLPARCRALSLAHCRLRTTLSALLPASCSLSRTVAGTLSLAHYSQRTASCFLLAVAHWRWHTVACALLSAHCVLLPARWRALALAHCRSHTTLSALLPAHWRWRWHIAACTAYRPVRTFHFQ